MVVGLTGGIACGKSTVSRLFETRRGVPVLDLDQVSRIVVEPGQPALREVEALWPDVVVDGRLDRKALAAKVVGDETARRALEAVLHPPMWAYMEQWVAGQASPIVVVESALIVETGTADRYDRLVVVSCSPAVQRARLMARNGFDLETAEKWIAMQVPLAAKEAAADVVVWNDGSEAELEASFDAAWEKLRE
jgi:dephospho-CoA kinase